MTAARVNAALVRLPKILDFGCSGRTEHSIDEIVIRPVARQTLAGGTK